jgi:hypothetical protein
MTLDQLVDGFGSGRHDLDDKQEVASSRSRGDAVGALDADGSEDRVPRFVGMTGNREAPAVFDQYSSSRWSFRTGHAPVRDGSGLHPCDPTGSLPQRGRARGPGPARRSAFCLPVRNPGLTAKATGMPTVGRPPDGREAWLSPVRPGVIWVRQSEPACDPPPARPAPAEGLRRGAGSSIGGRSDRLHRRFSL